MKSELAVGCFLVIGLTTTAAEELTFREKTPLPGVEG